MFSLLRDLHAQNKKVDDNVSTAAKGASRVGKKREYRQFMNRKVFPKKPK